MRAHHAPLCLASLLALAMLASPALADTEYCVGTVGQLQAALDDAEVDGTGSLIKVRSGTYNLSDDLRYQGELEYIVPIGKLTVRGGYNANCSSYSLNPGASTFTTSNQSELKFISNTGSISLAGLTLLGTSLEAYSQALSLCPSQRRSIKLSRIRIDQGMFLSTGWCHNVEVRNSLFTNGVGIPQTGYAADASIGIYLANDDDTYDEPSSLVMVGSTIVNGRMELTSEGGSSLGGAYLYNNLFSRAAGDEIFAEALVMAVNNRYDGISFQGGGMSLPGSTGNVSAAPQLDANFVPQPGSPMIDAGTSIVPDGLDDVDFAGGDRVVGARVDIGALESPVDGSGVFTVTNTNASGSGSLAKALENANLDPGFNRIAFNIPGNCPRTIALAGSLQVHEDVSFDGWSQAGSVINSSENGFNAVPCVILSGTGGIGIESMGNIGSGRISIFGLAFQGFDLAVALAFGEGHAVYGNQFAGQVGSSGPTLSGNAQAIGLIGGGQTTVGGLALSTRNLIGGSSDVGVLITTFIGAGGDDNAVRGNLIGLDKDGMTALPNGTGIRINGGFNRITANIISGNTVDGILLSGASAEGNKIIDNRIGAGTGVLSFTAPNGRMGVMVQSDAHDNEISDNTIGRNGDDGVRILSNAGGRNTVTGNRIARNQALGIDLGNNGVSSNDADPSFCDPTLGCAGNGGQNFPEINSAELRNNDMHPVDRPVRVKGILRSTVGGPYRIEVFSGDHCDANGHGEGLKPVAAAFLTIANAPYCPDGGSFCIACDAFNCTAPFTLWLPTMDATVGDILTLTATNSAGSTSEFSACMTVTEPALGDAIFSDGFEG